MLPQANDPVRVARHAPGRRCPPLQIAATGHTGRSTRDSGTVLTRLRPTNPPPSTGQSNTGPVGDCDRTTRRSVVAPANGRAGHAASLRSIIGWFLFTPIKVGRYRERPGLLRFGGAGAPRKPYPRGSTDSRLEEGTTRRQRARNRRPDTAPGDPDKGGEMSGGHHPGALPRGKGRRGGRNYMAPYL